MRVDELMRSLLRRPMALLLIAVVAAAGAYVGWNRATSTYESTAAVLVVPATASSADKTGDAVNPLTQLDNNIAQLALVVSSQLGSDGVRSQVVSAGGDGQYTADTLSSENSAVAQLSPLIRLTATGSTAAGAQRAVSVLVDQASAQLASVQSASNVPATAQAKVIDSTPATAGAVIGNPQLRSAGVLGIGGGFIALLLLVVLQPLLGRSRRSLEFERPVVPAVAAANRARAPAAGRFAPPTAERTVASPRPGAPAATSRRQEVLRQMVTDEWRRSGSNVSWTRREQRDAYQRAEERLVEKERRRQDLGAQNVSRLDDVFPYRDHG